MAIGGAFGAVDAAQQLLRQPIVDLSLALDVVCCFDLLDNLLKLQILVRLDGAEFGDAQDGHVCHLKLLVVVLLDRHILRGFPTEQVVRLMRYFLAGDLLLYDLLTRFYFR